MTLSGLKEVIFGSHENLAGFLGQFDEQTKTSSPIFRELKDVTVMDLSEMFPQGDDFQNLFNNVDDDAESEDVPEDVLGKHSRARCLEGGCSNEPCGDILEPPSKRMKTTTYIRNTDSEASFEADDYPIQSIIPISSVTQPNERDEDTDSSNQNISPILLKNVSPPNQSFKYSTYRSKNTRKIGNFQSSRKSSVFCDLCPKKFQTEEDANQHIMRDHFRQGSTPRLHCDFCVVILKTSNMESHVMQMHLKGNWHVANVRRETFRKPPQRGPPTRPKSSTIQPRHNSQRGFGTLIRPIPIFSSEQRRVPRPRRFPYYKPVRSNPRPIGVNSSRRDPVNVGYQRPGLLAPRPRSQMVVPKRENEKKQHTKSLVGSPFRPSRTPLPAIKNELRMPLQAKPMDALFKGRVYKIPMRMIVNYRPGKFMVGSKVCPFYLSPNGCNFGNRRCRRLHVEWRGLERIIRKSELDERVRRSNSDVYQRGRIQPRSHVDVIARRPSFVEPKSKPKVVPRKLRKKKNGVVEKVKCTVIYKGVVVGAPGFHDEECIFPVGYKSVINYKNQVITVEVERRIREDFPIYKLENANKQLSCTSASILQAWRRVTDVLEPSDLREAFGFASVELAKLPDARKYCSMNLNVKRIIERERKRKIGERRRRIFEERRKRRESYEKRFKFVRNAKEVKRVFQCEICLLELGSEEYYQKHVGLFHPKLASEG